MWAHGSDKEESSSRRPRGWKPDFQAALAGSAIRTHCHALSNTGQSLGFDGG
jgi:hypothetical protein